jgi:DNA gyrase subunit B
MRLRSLMAFVPRRYDPAVIEALALDGALEPEISREARSAALARVADRWAAATARHAGARACAKTDRC